MNKPGPLAPPFSNRPSLNITARLFLILKRFKIKYN